MSWPLRALLGPALWALAFMTIYALHGAGCAWQWPDRVAPVGNLHSFVLISVWGMFFAGGLVIALRTGKGEGRIAEILHLAGWTGVTATALTLFPVLGLTSCG